MDLFQFFGMNGETGNRFEGIAGVDSFALLRNRTKTLLKALYYMLVVQISGSRNNNFVGPVVILLKERDHFFLSETANSL
jgi:hypothetical protein